MDNLFIGLIYSDNDINWISKNEKSGFQAAANNFQWNFINGLKENLKGNLDVFSFLPIGTWPFNFKKIFIKTKYYNIIQGGKLFQFGFINIFIFKEIYRSIFLFFQLIKWAKMNPQGGTIYVYSLYTPFLVSMFIFLKITKKFHYCLIVPDLMGKYGVLQPWFTFLGFKQRLDSYFQTWLAKKPDCYVLLTKDMVFPLGITKKPYVVIECLVPQDKLLMDELENKTIINESEKRIILYYGSLNIEYGITTLLNAFLKIKNSNYELWICGPERQSDYILQFCKKDSRIKYLGFLMKEELLKKQELATLLINPRPNIGEYTKYSFPSKTAEYILSGKAVIMFKLDGVPNEYYDYVFLLSSFNTDVMALEIEQICSLSLAEINKFGVKAKQFIISNKNTNLQTKKIIDLISLEKNNI
jgi:glycosyltransferase involved in cell wall biosynthesis